MSDLKISTEDMLAINDNSAEFIGEGTWEKDSAYQIYKVDDRFIAILVSDQMSKWLEEWSAQYIEESEISEYI